MTWQPHITVATIVEDNGRFLLVEEFKAAGLEIYEPDVAAFRKFAQEKYLASDLAKSWPEGILEKVGAL